MSATKINGLRRQPATFNLGKVRGPPQQGAGVGACEAFALRLRIGAAALMSMRLDISAVVWYAHPFMHLTSNIDRRRGLRGGMGLDARCERCLVRVFEDSRALAW